MSDRKIRVGIMGLGQIGRQLYHLALEKDDIEIVAVADIGKPEIIEYLLQSDGLEEPSCRLQANYLTNKKFRTRMFQLARPEEVPAISSSARYGSASARRREAGYFGVASVRTDRPDRHTGHQ